jgi:hypothetical protein
LNLLHVIPRDERLHELLSCANCRSVFTALQGVSGVICEHLLAVAVAFIARGAIDFVALLVLGKCRFRCGGCECEALRLPSGAGTQHRSAAVPHTRGLLATLKIGERNGHDIQQCLRAEIGTILANTGL